MLRATVLLLVAALVPGGLLLAPLLAKAWKGAKR